MNFPKRDSLRIKDTGPDSQFVLYLEAPLYLVQQIVPFLPPNSFFNLRESMQLINPLTSKHMYVWSSLLIYYKNCFKKSKAL